ncbi:dimethylsulfonioproprionate lyase family protein [Paragemmobacter straminiformis]|uniref:Cupin domain-containing protein n=1 Tax=Paragemmobacter straminiformis TaxID=2045119 RepID=A0A842IB57_9RHOB|nr:dimethylsulfonioproprionate lyase family protein [Gemmobacter straminiformis]MBC2837272.1 cupin domain-containing protein [Gemmobacter straminiformis]
MDLAGRLAAGIRAAVEAVPEAAPFLADWPGGAERRAQTAGTLPVCRWLGGMAGDLAGMVAGGAGALEWRQTYGAGDFGAEFLSRYGWTEVVGLRGPIPSERVAAGFLLLGPEVTYPPHKHEAEEVYLPLSGRAWWQKGEVWRQVEPFTAIHHPGWVPHAMRTEGAPLLALYLWRGGDLAAKSEILREGG